MKNRHLAALAVALLAVGLLAVGPVIAPPAAAAKVTAGDLPSRAQFTKLFPALEKAEFTAQANRKLLVPAKKCRAQRSLKGGSGRVLTGERAAGRVIIAGATVVRFKQAKHARKAVRAYGRYVKNCDTYKKNGVKITVRRAEVPKVGKQRVGFTETTRVAGVRASASHVVVRRGRRVALATVGMDRTVPTKRFNRLAKVVARRMR